MDDPRLESALEQLLKDFEGGVLDAQYRKAMQEAEPFFEALRRATDPRELAKTKDLLIYTPPTSKEFTRRSGNKTPRFFMPLNSAERQYSLKQCPKQCQIK